jgi:hypothetical protein
MRKPVTLVVLAVTRFSTFMARPKGPFARDAESTSEMHQPDKEHSERLTVQVLHSSAFVLESRVR